MKQLCQGTFPGPNTRCEIACGGVDEVAELVNITCYMLGQDILFARGTPPLLEDGTFVLKAVSLSLCLSVFPSPEIFANVQQR